MPELPDILKKLPKLPKPPKVSEIFPNNPVTEALADVRATIHQAKDEISTIAQTIRVEDKSTPPADSKPAGGVAYSGSTPVVTREGVDAERMAWQDGIIRGELWLLEGHLKNNCVGCGGDVECCWKHSQNILDAARETQSMTTDPIYQEAISIIKRAQPFIHPEDIKSGKFIDKYPPLAIEVSQVRTQFDKRVMGHAQPPITLEEAKKLAAEEAAKEVERKWHSPEKK